MLSKVSSILVPTREPELRSSRTRNLTVGTRCLAGAALLGAGLTWARHGARLYGGGAAITGLAYTAGIVPLLVTRKSRSDAAKAAQVLPLTLAAQVLPLTLLEKACVPLRQPYNILPQAFWDGEAGVCAFYRDDDKYVFAVRPHKLTQFYWDVEVTATGFSASRQISKDDHNGVCKADTPEALVAAICKIHQVEPNLLRPRNSTS